MFFASCSPKLLFLNGEKIELPEISNEIYVFGANQDLPDDSKIIAQIKTKGNMFTSMDYRTDEVVSLIKKAATKLEANAVRINKINFPISPFTSKSYDMEAELLLVENIPNNDFKLTNDTTSQEGWFIYLYRPNRVLGSGISYPVYLNSFFLGGLDNNDRIIIKLNEKLADGYIELEAYGELYKIPIIMKTDKLVLKCKVGNNGKPKVVIEAD